MRIAVQALGCKTNQYEVDALAEVFRRDGWSLVGPGEEADVYVLNTCTVTAEAERKARQILRRYRRLNPRALVVASGCYAQREDLGDLADLLVGTGLRALLPQMIKDRLAGEGEGPWKRIMPATSWLDYEELGATAVPQETRAFLKIQDGCDNRCAYCAISLARGPSRSRDLSHILHEAADLVRGGFQELVLTGTNLNHYGRDLPDRLGLADVLEALDKLAGLERIRLGSLESGTISQSFVDRLARLDRFCPSFHLSLQSGSSRVLRAMRRRDRPESFLEAVDRLRGPFPQAGITTDLIVGFPGETEEDFEETLSFCDRVGFLDLHVFPFSPRPGTEAAAMTGRLSRPEVDRRARLLRRKADELYVSAIRDRLGQTREVLVEELDDLGRGAGYTPEYIQVSLEAAPEGLEKASRGQVRRVSLTGVRDRQALGRLLP